jgi:hypothetical protein
MILRYGELIKAGLRKRARPVKTGSMATKMSLTTYLPICTATVFDWHLKNVH